MHVVRCHMQLPFVACKVVRNGGDLSLSRGTATVEGGDAVARGRWADALSDLSAGYTDTTHHRTMAHLEPGDGGGASGGRAVSGTSSRNTRCPLRVRLLAMRCAVPLSVKGPIRTR